MLKKPRGRKRDAASEGQTSPTSFLGPLSRSRRKDELEDIAVALALPRIRQEG